MQGERLSGAGDRVVGILRGMVEGFRRDFLRYGRSASLFLDRVRSSPGLRRRLKAFDLRLEGSAAGHYLALFLGNLDRVALFLGPRLRRIESWALSLSRQERAAVAVAAIAIGFLGRSLATLPPARFVPARSLETAAFFENGWGGVFQSSFPALKRLAETGAGRGVDVIYPVWHTVMADGTVDSVPSREVLAYCRARGIAVIPVVTNAKVPGGDNSGVLRDREAMQRAVRTLVSEVEANGYDGLNLSFQLVPPAYRRRLTEFATSLSVAMRDRGRVFVVSVFPDTEMPAEVSGGYDYRALGEISDVVVLMAYDRHWPGSLEGPIAPFAWVDLCIRQVSRKIPVSKMTLGLGSYGYDWPAVPRSGKPEYLPASGAIMRAGALGAQVRWDQRSMEPYYEYETGGVPRIVRFLDRSAVALRAGLARKYGLRGVALWRLGFEE